jgi:hypothetical protein
MKKDSHRSNRLDEHGPSASRSKKRWEKPKLTFVKPKLTKHGKLEEVTGQFFGQFSPRVDQRSR